MTGTSRVYVLRLTTEQAELIDCAVSIAASHGPRAVDYADLTKPLGKEVERQFEAQD